MAYARNGHEVSDAQITVVEIAGWTDGDDEATITQGNPSHVFGYTAAKRVDDALTNELVALADLEDVAEPTWIARVAVDTHEGVVGGIELNEDVLREGADVDALEDPVEVIGR